MEILIKNFDRQGKVSFKKFEAELTPKSDY
jgi:hypothetical protein